MATVIGVYLCIASACTVNETIDPAPCYEREALTTEELCALLPEACPEATADYSPALSQVVTVVPDVASMPTGVVSQAAHNNLDIVWHRGRLFFAFRTAPFHFAHHDVVLYVVSTRDQKTWQLEAQFAMEKDLREPRFLPIGDRLFLYFARLSELTFTFVPEAMHVSEQMAGCQWSAPEEISPMGRDGFIPWRAREQNGAGYLIGYVGGEAIYEMEEGGVEVHWLKTSDGRHFEPAVGDESRVLLGGSSETDWAMLEEGGLVAVSRNESGDETGFGSKICTAPSDALGSWTCSPDPKKYDSPLLFKHGEDVYMIARRQVANDGLFDLSYDDMSFAEQAQAYQLEYWSTPKRCALWRVDAPSRSVAFVMDLPSNGDTCFASLVPLSEQHRLIYNYTSPLDDPELSWRDGQLGETSIYRTTLSLP